MAKTKAKPNVGDVVTVGSGYGDGVIVKVLPHGTVDVKLASGAYVRVSGIGF